jgi:hypothetical protein
MTKATAIKPIDDNAALFKDVATGEVLKVGKPQHKEADGKKRVGAHETPASKENLEKLAARFAKQ